MNYDIRIDRHLIRPAGGSVRYALVSITAPEAPPKKGREPLHLALVLDRSGSMGGPKIVLAREAVRLALQSLKPADRFSLVAYDDQIEVVVESVQATAEARRNALAKLARIDARGSTDLHGGWAAGCGQLAAHLGAADVGRCLLLTDGLANVGIDDPAQLVSLAGAARRDGRIATSTFGVGADFDERLLRGMADASGGRFYFIERPAQIPDLLTSELGELLQVVARDACLTLQLPKGSRRRRSTPSRRRRSPAASRSAWATWSRASSWTWWSRSSSRPATRATRLPSSSPSRTATAPSRRPRRFSAGATPRPAPSRASPATSPSTARWPGSTPRAPATRRSS